MATGVEDNAAASLLDDVVQGSVNFKGSPASRSKSGCWKSASFIIGIQMAERFAYFGISSNLFSYLTGQLGQSTATAAENVNAWNGTSRLLPLLGAFIADSFLGRYWTIVVASVVYILGLGLLSLSAAFLSSNSSKCKTEANNSACSPRSLEILLFVSLYLVAFAQGGHKPCVQAFGADQFDEEDEHEVQAKSSFFNWWNFSMNGGILAAILVLSYIQENLSWELGFGIPCIGMFFTLVVFLLGSRTYRFRVNRDERNPFMRIGRVFVKAAKNWNVAPELISVEREEQGILPHDGTKFKFLDKAMVATDGSDEDRFVCTIGDVEDAKAILRLAPIWCASLGYAIAISQPSTLFTKQAATMDRRVAYGFEVTVASLQSLICVSIMVFIPIYDCVLVPIARAITKNPAGISMLQRIGVGIFLSILLMVIAALVERRRLATAIEHGLVEDPNAMIPMSVWWLAPQYLVLGFVNVFALVGLQEFFYDQVPSELKSLGIALCLSITGVGNFLSSFLISIIEKVTSGDGHDSWFSDNLNQAHLDYFYWLLGGNSALTMAAYASFAKSYTYKRKNIEWC